MKTLLEILGISSISETEKKVSQGLRDEAVQEKANDELTDSEGKGISDALDALREARIEKHQAPAKKYLPPIWAIGFACLACTIFISFLMRENAPSPPADSPAPPEPSASSNQKQDILGWTDKALTFSPPSLANARNSVAAKTAAAKTPASFQTGDLLQSALRIMGKGLLRRVTGISFRK